MTVSSTESAIIVAATGASSYSFPFIGVSATDISVAYTNASGTEITLSTTAYTITLNAPLPGQIWGVGGTISPTSPSSYSGGSLTITRTLPLTQTNQVSNEGNQYPIVTEQSLDTLCMQIQQVAARTGAYRGVWATGLVYNFGDIIQDGANGAYTNNLYVCASSNTSSSWASDLANGDWSLALNVQTLSSTSGYLPLSGGTISGNLTVTGTASLGAGSVAVTPSAGDVSSKIATTSFVMSNGGSGGYISSVNVQTFTTSGTYVPSAGCYKAIVEMVGGGGGGGCNSAGTTDGTNGGSTTFGSFLTANGGYGAIHGNNGVPGNGGTVSVSSPAVTISAFTGSSGQGGLAVSGSEAFAIQSSMGGASPLGGVVASGASVGYGCGGSGGSTGGSGNIWNGGGGGAGGYIKAYIINPTTQSIVIGTGGTSAQAFSGAPGVVVVTEYINTATGACTRQQILKFATAPSASWCSFNEFSRNLISKSKNVLIPKRVHGQQCC